MIVPRHVLSDKIIRFYTVENYKKAVAERRGTFTGHMKSHVFLGSKTNAPLSAAVYHAHFTGDKNFLPKLSHGETSVSLFPNQKECFDKIVGSRCILVEGKTGSGKSVLIAALTDAWKGKTLILAHSAINVSYLANQIEKFTGVECGQYYAKKKQLRDITVTTFASAKSKFKMFTDYGFDNLIVDEADVFFTDKSIDFLCDFDADRKFGFTGTIKTNHDFSLGKNEVCALERFYGKRVVLDGGERAKLDPLEAIYYKDYQAEYLDEYGLNISASDWHRFREAVDNDIDRKNFMYDWLIQTKEDGDYTIVLFDRVADCEIFNELIPEALMINGKMKQKDRDRNEEKFKSEGGILLATSQTVGRGWDCPPANKIFLYTMQKKENTLRQQIGRVVRPYKNKKSYTYMLRESSILSQYYAKRKILNEYFSNIPIIKHD